LEVKKDWGWLIGLGIVALLLAKPIVKPPPKVKPAPEQVKAGKKGGGQQADPPPSPTENPIIFTTDPSEANEFKKITPVDYTQTITKLKDLGFTVIAEEETIAYGKGELSPTEFIKEWIDEAKEQGYSVPAEEELRDYYAGEITQWEYAEAYTEEVGKENIIAYDAWMAYYAGQISYDEYIDIYQAELKKVYG